MRLPQKHMTRHLQMVYELLRGDIYILKLIALLTTEQTLHVSSFFWGLFFYLLPKASRDGHFRFERTVQCHFHPSQSCQNLYHEFAVCNEQQDLLHNSKKRPPGVLFHYLIYILRPSQLSSLQEWHISFILFLGNSALALAFGLAFRLSTLLLLRSI